jgi:hypothetical protein
MSVRDFSGWIGQGVFALGTGVMSFLAALFWAHKRHRDSQETERTAAVMAREARIVELERQVALLGLTVQPLSAAFQAILIKQLSHFHTPRIDLLLSKIGPPALLTPDEDIELAKELAQRAVDLAAEISDGEREAATILPYVVQRVRREATQQMPLDIIVVAVPRSYE